MGNVGGGGAGDLPVNGLDGAVTAALDGLPGGLLAWGYPAFVMTVPGLLLLLAVGAQAIGALAWLPPGPTAGSAASAFVGVRET